MGRPRPSVWNRAVRAALVPALLVVGTAACEPPPAPPRFPGGGGPGFAPAPPASGLVTNEWAHANPGRPEAVQSADWEVPSGSLFARDGGFWTGKPDALPANAASSAGTHSAIFRVVSDRTDLDAGQIKVQLRLDTMVVTGATPRALSDGVSVMMRYQSPTSTYYASIIRRDGAVVVGKMCPTQAAPGVVNVVVGSVPSEAIRHDVWFAVEVTTATQADGSVAVTVRRDGKKLLTAVDAGKGCAPLTAAGRVGLKGDNANFDFKSFTAGA